MWKQSPISHLPVIYLFGLVKGLSYCSLKPETVGKQQKNYGKFTGKMGGLPREAERGYRRFLPFELDTKA